MPLRTPAAVAALTALALLLAGLLTAAPAAAHHDARPVAHDDFMKVRAGMANGKWVAANDHVFRKKKSRVRIVSAPGKLRARVIYQRRIQVRPRNLVRGKFTIRYRVIDVKGRRNAATLTIRVYPHAKSHLVRTRRLPVANENRSGYDRDKFNHWTDADSDCFDTRGEVLLQESKQKATWNDYCTVKTGKWWSYYDGVTTTTAGDFDTDHLVPLAEAWDSGARNWGDRRRERFANDLHDRRALVAVTASSNRSKSDRDPAEWLPPRNRAHCRYAREWVAVKTRWSLNVDRPERRKLLSLSRNCPHRIVHVTKAQ